MNGEDPREFSSCLREIAEKIDSGNLNELESEDDCECYFNTEDDCEYHFTTIDDTVCSRKFIVYSDEGYTLNPNSVEADFPIESNNSQILGITFGSCMKTAFYEFLDSEIGQKQVSQGFRSFIIRETVGEAYYEKIK